MSKSVGEKSASKKSVGASASDFMGRVFLEGRTHRVFDGRGVADEVLRELYEVVKLAPTASNTCPMRVSFVRSREGKAKLLAAAAEGNRAKIASAPVTAIVAYDAEFYQYKYLSRLAPHLDAEKFARRDPAQLEAEGRANAWLAGGFLIAAARGLGLDCGPMAGFDADAVNEAFYAGRSWRVIFLLNLGYGSGEGMYPRGARLEWGEAVEVV